MVTPDWVNAPELPENVWLLKQDSIELHLRGLLRLWAVCRNPSTTFLRIALAAHPPCYAQGPSYC